MHFTRLHSSKTPLYEQAMALYHVSFPPHAQRESSSQLAILRDDAYQFQLIYEADSMVGILLFWETNTWIYVEHFCIAPNKRNLGYGEKALALLAERGKPIILEIDPPVDEFSIRRKGSYERMGFHENDFAHVHPPYHPQYQGHPLVVMSRPASLHAAEYELFAQYLKETVMFHTSL